MYNGKLYQVPEKILRPYAKSISRSEAISAKAVFANLDQARTRSGALLKGLRSRENLTQVQFANQIGITQANLSSMENGRRPIGKEIAKRIASVFDVDYRYFLE
jgi:DNA-binding XRE family transcriptional regulator